MTDRENFIARWSRRKRAATEDVDATKAAATPTNGDPSARESERDASESATPITGSELPFDLSKLPPLESIGADTDIRAFLSPGVPPELTRAALRRAWAADPKVRDFVGLADYDWDFNTPGAIPGFGALETTDELRRQVAEMVGRSITAAEPEATDDAEEQAAAETTGESGPATATSPAESNCEISRDESVNSNVASYNLSHIDQAYAATQHSSAKSNDVQPTTKRSRGGALPK
jgi:Protein of unknown function (DUF3306)